MGAMMLLCLAVAPAAAQLDFNEITPELNPFGPGTDDPPESGLDGLGPDDPSQTPESSEELTDEQRAMEMYKKAIALMDEEKWSDALSIIDGLLSVKPDAADARLKRGICLFEIGEYELALESLDQATKGLMRYPSLYSEALEAQARTQLRLGMNEDAIQVISSALQANPMNAEMLFLRGKALIRSARMQQQSFLGGNESLGLFDQAEKSLTRSLAINPDHPEALVERSNARANLGQSDSSIDDMKKAVELDQENTRYKALLGYAYLRRAGNERQRPDADMDKVKQSFEDSIQSFTDYLNIEGAKDKSEFQDIDDPEFIMPEQIFVTRAEAEIGLASIEQERETELLQAAQDDARRARDFDDDSAMSYFQSAVAKRLSGDLEGAIETFTMLLELPSGAQFAGETLLRRGICYVHLGDFDVARKDFERSIASGGQVDGRAQFWTGVAYAKEGNYLEAIRQYNAAIRRNPMYKPAYNNRGLTFLAMGDYKRAAADFDELIRRNHEDSVARQRREYAREMMNR